MNCIYKFKESENLLTEEELFYKIREELKQNPALKNIAGIVYKSDDPVATMAELKRKGIKALEELRRSKPYIGVGDFIEAIHPELSGTRLTAAYIDEEREPHYIEQHKNDYSGTEEQKKAFAKAAFDDQILEEGRNKKVGSFIHELVHVLLENKGPGSEYTKKLDEIVDIIRKENLANEYTLNDKSVKATTTTEDKIKLVKKKLQEEAESIYKWIKATYGSEYEIYSELPLLLKKEIHTFDENNKDIIHQGLFGIADLVLLNKKTGEISIIDFKTSSREYKDWSQAKLNEVDYQLALYRSMFSAAGFDGSKIKLFIKPILFLKLNISSLDASLSLINALSATHNGARLGWIGGKFTNNLRRLSLSRELMAATSSSDFLSLVNEDRNVIIGHYDDPKSLTKEWYIKNEKIIPDKNDRGDIIGYKFYSYLEGSSGGWIKGKTLEDFTKDGGLIDLYLNQVKANRDSIADTVVNEITVRQTERNGGKKSGLTSYLRSDNNAARKQLLETVLGRYEDPQWTCLSEQFPDLLELGIIVFSKPDSVNPHKQILEFVNLVDTELNQIIPIAGNTTVLGLYYDNDLVSHLGIHPLESSYKNIKGIEFCIILNKIVEQNPENFSDVKLSKINFVNPSKVEADATVGVNLETLLENFNLLCLKAGIKNNLTKISRPTTYEYCMLEVLELLLNRVKDPILQKLLKNIDLGAASVPEKLKVIRALIEELRLKYRQLLRAGEVGGYVLDLNKPEDAVYYLLTLVLEDLSGVHMLYDGRMPKHAANLTELFSALGLLIPGNTQKRISKDGTTIVGLLNGLEITSPGTSKAPMKRLTDEYLDIVYNSIRRDFDVLSRYISKLTKSYLHKFGTNNLIDSSHLDRWEHLIVKENGKISPELKIKDPWDMTNDLTPDDREFLKELLWEINKYLIPDVDTSLHWKSDKNKIESLALFKEWKNSGRYFQLPLAKAPGHLDIKYMKDVGLKTFFLNRLDKFKEAYDPREIHSYMREKIKKDNSVKMSNNYILTQAEREAYIQSVGTPYDFNFNLEFLAMDVAYQSIRKEFYDNALLLNECVLVTMNVVEDQSGADMKNEKEAIINQNKILRGESLLSEENKKTAEVITGAKKLTSVALLALRPLLFLKEITFGFWSNFSRAWILKTGDGSNKLSLKSVSLATGIIWGQSGKKVTRAMFDGNNSLADFYLVESINKLYGIANLDIDRLSQNASSSRIGIMNNPSKWMYIFLSAPDYFNRMTLFIAKMIEDGCYDAHELNKDGDFVYNWKKDKRFSELAKHGLNSNYSSPEYNKLKALYRAMCEEFEKDGKTSLITLSEDKTHYILGDITQAYTPKQKGSIKEVADLAFGFYANESKAPIYNTFFGLVFLQFLTFLSGKYNLWLKAPATAGENTKQGHFEHLKKNGVLLYTRILLDENDKIIGQELVPETELTEEEKNTLEPAMRWVGDYTEGLMYSIIYAARDFFTLNWRDVVTNKLRRANLLLAAHDLLAGMLLFWILKTLFSGGSGKMTDVKPLLRVFLRSILDVGPQALTSVSLTPAFINTILNLKNDSIQLLVDSEKGMENLIKHIGTTKDWVWNED